MIVMSTVALLASPVASPIGAGAVGWDPEWEVSVGRSADAVATDASGNVYVTGTVRSADGSWRSMVIARYAADGEELWRRAWPAHSKVFPYSMGRGVAVSPNGDTVFVVGAELNDSTEHARAKVWAYTADGDLGWHRSVWGSSSLVAEGVGVGPDSIVVGGTTFGECSQPFDGRIVAFAIDGGLLWSAPFEAPQIRRSTSDAVRDVAVDDRGRVFAVGMVERREVSCDDSMVRGRWADGDVLIQRFAPSGGLTWSKVMPDAGVKDRDSALAVDADGAAVMVAGHLDGSRHGGGRAWIARVSPRRRIVWSTYAGARPSVASDVALTPWGDVQLVGEIGVKPRLFVRAYSPDGELLSRRHLNGAVASGVAASDEPALYVIGGRNLWRLPAG